MTRKSYKMGIYLICQFFIPIDHARRKEIEHCLKVNSHNNAFDRIILLNERLYSVEELGEGANPDSITLILIGHRLKYSDALEFAASKLKPEDTIVIANADIFFDDTIRLVAEDASEKLAHCLTRYEYSQGKSLDECILFERCRDSQDVWILGNRHNTTELKDCCNFELGRPGCDNRVCYELTRTGFKCVNDCSRIRTYHFHSEVRRSYGAKVPPPYAFVSPC